MKIPLHIAIIMDGNGRWAVERGLPRKQGHIAGVNAFKKIITKAAELGVRALTVYAFSTENWNRPKSEVDFILNLFQKTLLKQADELFKNNVKVKVIGRRIGLSRALINTIEKIEKMTADNKGIQLNIAFNYGGRAEIVDMAKKIVNDFVVNNETNISLTEQDINRYLYNPGLADVELLVRTGGERRLSNFLLWQSAYTELCFFDKYWPDFTAEDLVSAIKIFQQRERRFGGLNKVGEDYVD